MLVLVFNNIKVDFISSFVNRFAVLQDIYLVSKTKFRKSKMLMTRLKKI